jgi:DNA-binding MarR family transcriptional regulator
VCLVQHSATILSGVTRVRALSFDPIAEAERKWIAQGWSDAAPGMAVVTSVMRAQQLLLARVDAELRPFDLTFARYEVLMLLSFSTRGSLPLGKVGERLQVNPGSVTNAVDRLEAAGLVRREPNPVDGRGTLAALTDEGRRIARQATVALNSRVFTALGVTDVTTSTLFELLQELRQAAGDFV